MSPASRPDQDPQTLQAQIAVNGTQLPGELVLPPRVNGIVLFAHGSASSRHSPRNQSVAGRLQERRLGTLLFDLLSSEEEAQDRGAAALRFDIPLLARRLLEATRWVREQAAAAAQRIGYFGASTGAAAALMAAAAPDNPIAAVVSRGGRPDLAGDSLERVQVPTLLLVGSADGAVVDLNRHALRRLHGEKRLHIVPGATHLFEEAGTLEEVARQAAAWFGQFLQPA